jgi:hypothetical protein
MMARSGERHRRPRWPIGGGAALACLGLNRGALAADDLAPDIAARIGMALEVVERLRAGLEARIAAFADLPDALAVGLDRLREDGGILPVALAFGLMLTVGAAAEWLTRRPWRRPPVPHADAVPESPPGEVSPRLVPLLAGFASDLGRLSVFAAAASGVLLLASGGERVRPAILVTYLGAILAVRLAALG